MAATNLIFYPKHYIGFNKVALLERQLQAAGFVEQTLSKSSYLPGRYFNHFIPMSPCSHRYMGHTSRIHLQAVGLWLSSGISARLIERTNLVIIEVNNVSSMDGYQHLINLLKRITGDEYCCQVLPDYSMTAIEDSQRARFA